MKMHSACAAVLAFFCLVLVAGAASGQIAGFKISEPVISNQTTLGADADFDILAYGSDTTPPFPVAVRAGTPIANSSVNSFTQTYSFGNGDRPYFVRLAVNSAWNTSAFPAIDFGDGSIQQTMALALDTATTTTGTLVGNSKGPQGEGVSTPFTYRGSFSHTYPNGNFQITSYLTPVGTYGSPVPGAPVDSPMTTGTPYPGTLVNTFVYQVTVSPLSPPGTGTYTYQNTDTNTNTFTNTVLKARAIENVEINATPPTLTVDGGLCPGTLDITISDGTPGARVTFWAANNPGAHSIGMGPCASTVIDLDTTEPRRTAFFDGSGVFSFTRFFTPAQCGILMQAVNHGSCAKSGVVLPPVAPPPPTVPTLSSSAAGAGPGGGGLGTGRN